MCVIGKMREFKQNNKKRVRVWKEKSSDIEYKRVVDILHLKRQETKDTPEKINNFFYR